MLDHKSKFHEMGGHNIIDVEIVFLLLTKELGKQVEILQNIVSLIQNEDILNMLKGPDALKVMEDNFRSLV